MADVFKKQPEFSLDLRKDGAGNVAVIIVDEKGEPVKDGCIMRINTSGRLALTLQVNEEAALKAGIKLDSVGKIDTV